MKKFFKSSYFAIVMLFLYVPIVIMIVFSFNSGSTVFDFVGFSGSWYSEFFNNSPFIKSIITSLFVAVVSTVISLIIGVMAAIGLSKTKKVTQKAWFSIANIPLINADVVTAVSLMIIFLMSGMKFGIGTLILAHVSFNVPYVLITVMPRLRKVDSSMIEAAYDLGSKPYQILFRVILPVLKPAIITAAAIAFAMSFDDFIISYFTGGDQTNVSTFIYTAKRVKPFIYAFGTLLVAVIVFIIIIWNAQAVIRMKRKQIQEEIKQGWYKAKEIDKLNKKLNKEYLMLINENELKATYRISLWFKYLYLKTLIKIFSLRNYNKRISKLEWKQYKIRNEIRNEKRYYSRLDRTKKTIIKVQRELNKKSTDIKKAAKLTIQLEKLNEKREFLESEIEWIEDRENKAAERALRIGKEIKVLKKEFNKEKNTLSKKDIAWYKNKIKKLEEYKIEVEEGKNHYKLRMTTEKLKEVKALRDDKLYGLNEKLKVAKGKVYTYRSFGYKFDKQIAKTKYSNKVALIQLDRENYIQKIKNKLEWKIVAIENKLDTTQSRIESKRLKLMPNDNENETPRSKGFFQRTWKILLVGFLGVAAFSGLTVAYVMNNIYDLVVGNWGEYIDINLIKEFEKESGLKVNYQTYDSNETLYNKLYTFNYDLMVPSDYMVQKMANEDMIQKIDWSKLNIEKPSVTKKITDEKNNKEKINGTLSKLMSYSKVNNKDGESNITEYGVPYFWGDLVIVFNQTHDSVKELLDQKGFDIENNSIVNQDQLSWEIIKEAKNKGMELALPEDSKNLFLIESEIMYQKVNLTSKEEIDNVAEKTADLIKGSKVSLLGDNMLSTVTDGSFDIAVMYSGDLNNIMNDNRDPKTYTYGRPNMAHGENCETTNVYTDNMVISSNATHLDAAYKFVNFIFKKQNAIKNSEAVGIASTNDAAMKYLAENGKYKNTKTLYEPIITDPKYIGNEKDMIYRYQSGLDEYIVDKYNDIVSLKN